MKETVVYATLKSTGERVRVPEKHLDRWVPSEWRERDLTKDSKKQSLPYEKRLAALKRWAKETFEGKYTKQRLQYLNLNEHITEEELIDKYKGRLKEDRPIKVPTSPCVRVGVEKNLCPNLVEIGEKVAFAKDFSEYLTYKSRKSNIAGGEIEDMNFDTEIPEKGYLSMYREEDGRVPTPAIEIGAISNRYRHIGIVNIPRSTSLYGAEIRSLFGCGAGAKQLAFDFSSLEAVIMGHYVWKYTDGQQLAQMFLAPKPNDVHTKNSEKLGIDRTEAKNVFYGLCYGAQVNKLVEMLKISKAEAQNIYDGFWDGMPALKELKDAVESFWERTGRKYIIGIDGRKLNVRSKHSILNTLFQSAGVICAKYTTVFIHEELSKQGFCIDPFIKKPDVCSMCEYHDEAQFYVNPSLITVKNFSSEDGAKAFIKAWNGDQLSTISHVGRLYSVALPNPVSKAIKNSIDKVVQKLKLNVPLGFEWVVGNNWFECH